MTEQFANNATTTVTTAVLSTDTTIAVASATLFPSTPQFRIMIDSEIMIVTGIASNIFTVTRGAENTLAVAHNNGATVEHILTSGAITQFKTDIITSLVPSATSSLAADTTIATVPSFTNLVNVTVSGSTKYLVMASISGQSNGAMTMWARVQTDGVAVNGQGTYSDGVAASGNGIECKIMFIASGLTTGSHTFTLQAAGSPNTATIHANTVPLQEGANIIAIAVN